MIEEELERIYAIRDNRDNFDFFDSYGLYIGIIPNADGDVWVVEVCGIPLMEITHSRSQAEEIAVKEAKRVLLLILNNDGR